jgi:Domain of unknown function (DUF5664)
MTRPGVPSISSETYGKPAFQQTEERIDAPLPEESAKRKEYPMYGGLFAYFPDALAEVARVSYLGNQKHNPGQPLHWSRDKSSDHLDCIARHLTQAGSFDYTTNVRHSAQLAWRALANLQIEIERSKGIKK